MEVSKYNLRVIMFYNWKRGLNSEEMANEICQTLNINCVTVRTCRNWIAKFDSGDYDFVDEHRSVVHQMII